MKKALLFFAILVTFGFTYTKYSKQTSIILKPNSKLIIKGKTNVSNFNCYFDLNNINNPIPVYYLLNDNKMVFKETELVLENDCFDCGNKAMNKDFRALLKSEIHPKIHLQLKELENLGKDNVALNAILDLKIAGETKPYNTPVILEVRENNLFVKGKLVIDICDFGLEPPKKLLGLITVDNIIEVDFQLLIQETNI